MADLGKQADMAEVTCVVPGCANAPAKSRRGMCGKHYRDWWKSGHSCSVGGCERPYLGDGFCSLHYDRARDGRSFDAPVLGAGKAAGCAVGGCGRPYHAGGYCGLHSARLRRTGDPLAVSREPREACTITGCARRHMALGYCAFHYKRYLRYGHPDPAFSCKACGDTFVLGRGSYFYCAECHVRLPAGYRAKRLRLLAANNEGMTDEDRQLSADYLLIIRKDPCVYCGAPSTAVDHIVPIASGGSDRWDNQAPACKPCNSAKRSRTLLGAMLARLDAA